ncbi:SDR family oxidoreductase [Streptomyces sp. NBC_01304]|uniref:SDR family oxidoreductase n=1 Tax=Streptomyces sp. NBC_01304 TaxID=2903818 RepID=UPI002E1358CD|nr:SDR family oxidoreductase [Streptomyces sp. NBC_01304]
MILVTGATGTVGSLLVSALRAQDRQVRALVRNPAKAPDSWDAGVQLATADFEDPKSLDAAVDGVEAVYVLCGTHPQMAEYERHVFDAVIRSGAGPKVVLHSVVGVDQGPPNGRFAVAHVTAFDHLKSSGVADWTVLAPGTYFQNLISLASSIKAGVLAVPGGDGAVSYVDGSDIADVAAHVLTTDGHSGQVYTLTGPEAVTHAQIAAGLGKAAGHEVSYRDVAPEQVREGMLGAGVDAWTVDGLLELYEIYRAGHASRVSDAVPRLLGRPARGLDDFATAHSAVFR